MTLKDINVLIVGGYDPTGGAGIIADVKTIKALKCNPLTVITSLIPQNNNRVYSKMDLPKDNIRDQFKAIFEDFEVSIVKTGVLTKEAIDVLLDYQRKYNLKIICDPVLKSSTGYNFIEDETLKKYFELFKKSLLIMPNSGEYNIIKNSKYFEYLKNSNNYILITGIEDKLFYNSRELRTFKGHRIDREVHGTGCVFASGIASFIAKGHDIIYAIREGKRLVLASVIYAKRTKYGYNTNPTYINREEVIKSIGYAIYLLKKMDFHFLIPEEGSNIAEGLILPRNIREVASLVGGIIKKNKNLDSNLGFYRVGEVEFGVFSPISNIIITANHYNPRIRSAITIKYYEDIIEILKSKKYEFTLSSFEGERIKGESSKVMELGTKLACEKFEGVPDIIYGDLGRESIMVVLGENALEVVKKVKKIIDIYKIHFL
ncbi:MAG TPA: phosphomethylpyrimidine kinase [Methanothermococcus okinawensis]|uniref:Phosphomethylpyrimidine kinase n=1 Tax=Methanothermococcus okinawensis TaxID=155863 RepID=A0A832YRU8_9EURY|nr:phosphomethylpyrimidine kinase [Methanothermococcus okinawensis]